MSTKTTTGSAAGEETSVMRQLELLLVPLHHRFRYPLPVPAHLADGADANADASLRATSPALFSEGENARAGATSLTSVSSVDAAAVDAALEEVPEEQQRDRLHRAALGVVEEQVPDLLQWQTRVQNGATQAENCYQVLEHVRRNIAAMQQVTQSVQEQSDHLSHNASAMMVRKAKLELVRDALEQNLAHFTHIDDLCREAGNPFLKAGTPRFSTLLQDIASEMEFLSTNTQYKSAKPYAVRLAVAQQMVNTTLKEAVRQSFKTIEEQTEASPAFVAATHVLKEPANPASDGGAAAPVSTEDSAPSPVPELRRHDVAGSFADFLAAVNDAFVAAGNNFTSLRRMAELRQGGFGYTGAEAFGEEMLTASGGIEADAGMKQVLDSYRDARVAVVVPLLRYWLTLWYYLDVQDTSSEALSHIEASQAQQRKLGSDDCERLSGVAGAHTLPQLAEHICGLLQRSLAAESEVLNRMWLRDDIATYLLPKLVSSIAEEVYYTFRSRLLCVDDVGELSRTVESIQRVSLRQDTGVQDSQVVADLWLRMIQDTQERLVFRTSVYLRQTVARCTPTREVATVYLRCGADAYNAAAASPKNDGPAATEAARTRMFFLPGVVHALQLLHWLYPTLEFSVFSVFAEEAVHHSLDLVRQLVKFMRQIDSSDALRDTKAYLCQLSHLQHLESELSHVDANITVVERHLSFAGLRESRLELEQSSRESKKEVQVDLLKCSEQLTTAMLGYVTQPLSGAAKKGETERRKLVAEMKGRAAGVERMIAFYIEHHETLIDLVSIIRERTAELAAEVDVPLESVAATTVPVRAIALPQLPAPQAESKGSSATPSNVSSPDGPAPEAVAAPAEGNATATPNEAPASSPLPPPPAYSETAPSVQTLPPPPLSAPKTGETERAYSHPRPVKHSDDTDLI
ncbi:Sec34-like family [Lotmaria passim]